MKLSRFCTGALACLALALFLCPNPASAAPAAGSFKYLDDDAEEGGFDVTATVATVPAEFTLAQQENGDGYYLTLGANDTVAMSTQSKGVRQLLAQVHFPLFAGPLVAQRRGPRWRLVMADKVVLECEDDRWQSGKIGYQGGLGDVKVQPVEDIAFDDDFMRVASDVALAAARANPRNGTRISTAKTDETLWRTFVGSWSTTGMTENDQALVAQSANPFAFKCSSAGVNLAFAGHPFWSDYSAECSVKSTSATSIGIALDCRDAGNYLLFDWAAKGPLELRAVVGGQSTVLDRVAGGFDKDEWYRLRLSISDGVLRAFVDGAPVLRARTNLFGRGEVGLYADDPADGEGAIFDDVSVRSNHDFYDDFAVPVAGRWQMVTGGWKMAGAATPADARGAYGVMGESGWKDYTTSALITLPADSAAGLVLYHRAAQGTYLLRAAGSRAKLPYAGSVQILKIAGGKTFVLAQEHTAASYDGKRAPWGFSDDRGYLKATVDGQRVLDAYDDSLDGGRAGMYAQRGAIGVPRLESFAVEFAQPHQTWAKVPDLEQDERQAESMGGWSTPQGFWDAVAPIGLGTPVADSDKMLWHKGTFWGDDSLRFKLPPLKGDQTVNLLFDRVGPAGAGPLKISFSVNGNTLSADISRDNQKWSGKATLPTTAGATTEVKSTQGAMNLTNLSQLATPGPQPAPPTGQPTVTADLQGTPGGQQIEVLRRGSFIIIRLGAPDQQRTLVVARVN